MIMKIKKMVFSLVVIVGLVITLALGAQAAQGWFLGYTVSTAGPIVVAGGATVNRIGGTFTKTSSPTLNCWFTSGREKEMLAVALTALANGKTVDLLVDTTVVNSRYTIMDMMIKP
jgi:hypothetical protein